MFWGWFFGVLFIWGGVSGWGTGSRPQRSRPAPAGEPQRQLPPPLRNLRGRALPALRLFTRSCLCCESPNLFGVPPPQKKKTPKPGGGEFPVPGSVPPNPPGYRPGEVQGSCRGAARCFSTGFLSPNTLKKKNNPPPSRCHISYLEISFHRDLIAWPELCNYSYFFSPSSTASVVKPVF